MNETAQVRRGVRPPWWRNVPLPESHLIALAAGGLLHFIAPVRAPVSRRVGAAVGLARRSGCGRPRRVGRRVRVSGGSDRRSHRRARANRCFRVHPKPDVPRLVVRSPRAGGADPVGVASVGGSRRFADGAPCGAPRGGRSAEQVRRRIPGLPRRNATLLLNADARGPGTVASHDCVAPRVRPARTAMRRRITTAACALPSCVSELGRDTG